MRMKITALLLVAPIVAALGSSPEAGASPGALDRSFGGDGRVTTNFGRGSMEGFGVAIQQNGRIVAVGGVRDFQRFGLTRYRRDGTLDPSFGGDGRVSTDFRPLDQDEAQDVAVQADGSLVVLGRSGYFGGGSNPELTLARYLPDGSIDPAFGNGGQVTIDFDPNPDVTEFAAGVAIDAEGMIVAGASINANRFGAARYDTDGNPDSSFDGDGMVTTKIASGREEASDVVIQADGRIVVVGDIRLQRFALVRYTDQGALDPSFGGDGTITTNFGRGALSPVPSSSRATASSWQPDSPRGSSRSHGTTRTEPPTPPSVEVERSRPTSPPEPTSRWTWRSVPMARSSLQEGASTGHRSSSPGTDGTVPWIPRSVIAGR